MSFEKEFQHLQLHIPLKDIKLATNNFGNDHCIGRGGFGKVYRGELLLSCGLTIVAIKRLDSTLGQGAPEFWKEIMMLSRYKHENIVSLLGFCNESGESILVYEYLSNKSLDLYLRSTDLSWNQRLRICIGAACGLQYLHDPNGTQQRLLHRDIKSANILLDQNWNAKISDFGLSKIGPANQQYTFLASNAVGTFGYCDPLYRKTGYLTKESDIYSFGVVLFEVLCGRFCMEDYEDDRRFLEVLAQRCNQEKKVDTIIKSDLKGQISLECLERFSTIAYQCLQEDRTKRPLIAEIVKELRIAFALQNQMAMQAASPAAVLSSAQVVGNAFVEQYYHILHQSPELVHKFYQDSSILSRPDTNGLMSSVTTMQAIDEKIQSLDYKNYKAEIKTADAQDSYQAGVIVLVTGCLTGKESVKRKFAQTFFLAPQEKGYFVQNDVFRYVEESAPLEPTSASVEDIVDSAPVDHALPNAEASHVSDNSTYDSGTNSAADDLNNEPEVCDPEDNEGSESGLEEEVCDPEM